MKELLPETMQMLVNEKVVTVEQCLDMMRKFGGTSIYVPKIPRKILRELILKEYNGKNIREIALKYGRTERTIYSILKSKIKPKNN